MQTAYVIDAVRTPIGKYGGALAVVRPDDLVPGVPEGRAVIRIPRCPDERPGAAVEVLHTVPREFARGREALPDPWRVVAGPAQAPRAVGRHVIAVPTLHGPPPRQLG